MSYLHPLDRRFPLARTQPSLEIMSQWQIADNAIDMKIIC